jgi:hypothetical protein
LEDQSNARHKEVMVIKNIKKCDKWLIVLECENGKLMEMGYTNREKKYKRKQ